MIKKKLLLICCIATLGLGLVACGNNDSSSSKDASESTSSIADVESTTDSTDSTSESSTVEATTESNLDATEIMTKTIENVKNIKNCQMKANMDMDANISIMVDGKETEDSGKMKTSMEADVATNDNGMHSVVKTTTNEGSGDIVETEDKYSIFETKKSYTSTDDGKTWYETDMTEDESSITNLDGLFENEDAFKDAKVEKSGENYVITVDVSKVEEFAKDLSDGLAGTDISGSIIIVVDKEYLPVSIEMKDIDFDTSIMEEAIKEMANPSAESDFTTENVDESSSESSTSEEPSTSDVNLDVSIDLSFSFKLEYSSWNAVADDLVIPEDSIITNSISMASTNDYETTEIEIEPNESEESSEPISGEVATPVE